MSNHTIEFSTENNDRVQLTPMNGGLSIHIVPVDKLPGQSAWDVFEIGLRKSSLKKLLLAIKRNESYSTDYHQNIIGRDKSGKIYFHNKTNLSVYPEHNCVLDADQSTEFIRLIGLFVNGLPPELEAFVGIEDGYVQHQVMKAVDEPALLNTPKFWDELGMAVGTAGVPTEAMNCFYNALQLDPDYHLSKLNLATSLNAIGNTIEALRLIEEVPNGTSRRNVIMGNTLRSAGRDLDAVPYFEKAVIEEPDFFLPYFNLLKILSANNHPLYEYWLEKSLEAHRQVPVIAHFYTQLLLEQHRIDELADLDWVDHLQNTPSNLGVIGRNSDDPVYITLAQLNRKIAIIYRDGDDETLPSAIDTLAEFPDEWDICMQSKLLASAAVQSGRPELISIAYEHVCPICKDQEIGVPRHIDTMLAKGYEYKGDWEKALQCCEKVLATDPKHLETLSIYYWNLNNADRVDDAIRNAEYLYSLDPSRESLSYNLGYFHGKVGQLGRAEFYYLQELGLVPEHWAALENLSFIHILAAKYDEAQDTFDRSLDIRRREFLEALPYLDPEDVQTGEEVPKLKSLKFSQLLKKARQLQGDSTYTLQLQELNMSGDVRIGANTAIERNPYSRDRLLSMLGSGTKADIHEVLFEYGLEERGDYSIRLTELISQIPGFYDLPKEAQSSLIEGEKRFKEAGYGDFSPVIVSFK